MPLTDPELDLLRELLADDPTDEVFLQVGEELVRRAAWVEAEDVLRRGLAVHDEAEGWAHLARAALEIGDYTASLKAWARSGSSLQGQAELRRVHALALERSGRVQEAREAVERYLAIDPNDVVMEAAKERIEAPPPASSLSASDPFLTVRRAEQYAAIGRPDRAVRIYRRILFHHPDDLAIRSRLVQLDSAEEESLPRDLSEELLDPNLVPPDLTMPMPGITSASVEPSPVREAIPSGKPSGLAQFMASSREAERRARQLEEDTEEVEELPGLADMGLSARPKRRKKRRSLLKR
ncbi:MAG: tetratricopeptide repeat protein [Myxococcota bacterium]